MGSHVELAPERTTFRHAAMRALRSRPVAYAGRAIALGVAYYAAAKVGQTLRYTASVAAIWPPAGLGIAALYLYGLRWWPGILLGELMVNTELLLGASSLPVGGLLGQQAGNMAEIVVGALLLRRLIGPRAALDRVSQVVRMLAALATAAAISATCGALSMLAVDVVEPGHLGTFWRTWWLGDSAGGLVVLAAALAWAADPRAAWRRVRSWEGALLIAGIAALSAFAASTDEPRTYVVFPGLIWAALRFGPPGATLAVAISTGVVVGLTAHELGPFSKQPIDHRTLSTQLYIVVTAVTTLLVAAVVSERERAAKALADARRREGEQAAAERQRIARDLHDSVAQALFSARLHTRAAQRRLGSESGGLARELSAIAELTGGAQHEVRDLVLALRHDPVADGLVAALASHAAEVAARDGLRIDVREPAVAPPLSHHAEEELFAIAREALANAVKHAGATAVSISVETGEHVVVEIRDDGRGFDPGADHPGHFGLDSMRTRAAEIGARLTIASAPGRGTRVRVEAPASA